MKICNQNTCATIADNPPTESLTEDIMSGAENADKKRLNISLTGGTKLTAKEYLNQAYKIDRRIKINKEKIKKMRDCLDYKGLPENTGASHGSSTSDGMSDTVCSIIEFESRTQELIDKLAKLYLEIENSIQSISDPIQREVLERRYLLYQSWESHYDSISGEYIKGIAEDMRYSSRQIYYIHGEALKNIAVNCSELQL